MHADHHGGLYRILEYRRQHGAPPLLVIGPMPLFRVLNSYSRVVSGRPLVQPLQQGGGFGALGYTFCAIGFRF